jgi:transposase
MKYLGIDIGKETFEVCLADEASPSMQANFVNNASGFKKLKGWLKKHKAKQGHVCMEATGIYGDALAEYLHEQGYKVSVVNPARIKAYADSQMQRNKTDKLDAALIADYCRRQEPPAWTPPTPEFKELRALVRHLADLKQERQRASNRLAAQQTSQAVQKQLHEQIQFLDKQIKATRQLIEEHIQSHPGLKQDHDLLTSIPGIGDTTASHLLAELGDIRRFENVREVVAFVGLNPRQHQSGKKSTTHGISRMGRASLRAALYMPALVAKGCNPNLKAWASGLKQRGLTGKEIIVAVMRKLIHLAYGILKSRRAFDVNFGKSVALAA